MQITPADAAVRDLDVDVRLLELLRLEIAPDHLALGGGLVEALPAAEGVLVLRGHNAGGKGCLAQGLI